MADIPTWWLCVLYAGLLIALVAPFAWRHGRWVVLAGLAWLALGVILQVWPRAPGEFRCTFVAVGHGGCTVLETPGGRVIVYDAGATAGADVTRRQIAPFLWSRGIRRIDELIISHGDLDHFNGVPALADRFAIGRVLATPTFAQRDLRGVQQTLAALERRGIAIETVHRGMRWQTDGVTFTALHPPEQGPDGPKENIRSLVLQVQVADWSMLLTGDLEDAGLTQVLALPPPLLDVLMAPHHGSDRSNNAELARWARPTLVVSSQAAPLNERQSVRMYEKLGMTYLGTWPNGAITLRPTSEGTLVETFRTGRRFTVK